jgi:hypothetical protein
MKYMCNNYTAAEIEAAITDGVEADWYELSDLGDGDKTTITLRGAAVEIEKVGGKAPCEGGAEDVSVVIKVGSQLFEKTGYYASHYGCDWDGDVTEVRPVEKIITVYERVG